MISEYVPCFSRELPPDQLLVAASDAIACNPANAVPELAIRHLDIALASLNVSDTGEILTPRFLAVLTGKYWGVEGANIAVSFMESVSAELRNKILAHANAWSEHCNIKFWWSQSQGQIRITLEQEGYWSFVGRDCLYIPPAQPTMCLSRFSLSTPDSEYRRVIRHEFGHASGFPHEHQLPQIVAELDPEKTIAWGWRTMGWNANTVRQQILTPLDPRSLRMTANADKAGIMCYALPASITKSGKPIPGGMDIDELDAQFAAQLYPKPKTEPPPPVEPPTKPEPPTPPPPNPGGIMGFLDLLKILSSLKPLLDFFRSNPELIGNITSILSKLGELLKAKQLVARAQGVHYAPTNATTRDDYRASLLGFVAWARGVAALTATQADDALVRLAENALSTDWLFDLLYNLFTGQWSMGTADLAWASQESRSVTV